MAMGVEPFERGIKLSSERVKLGKGYWVFVNFFLLGFVIDLLLLFLLFVQIFFLLSKYVHFFYYIFFLLSICWIS